MVQILGRSNPWQGRGCNRRECFQCQHGGGEGGDCQQESVLYLISCLKCKEKGNVVEYVGESSRTGHRRGADHLADLRNGRIGKPLWDHAEEAHGGDKETGGYKMKVLKKYRTPLERQIGEALEIERRLWTADCLLNKKEEYNGTKIPRLRLESIEIREEDAMENPDDDKKNRKDRRNRMRSSWLKQPAQKRKVEREDAVNEEPKTNKFKKRRLIGHTQACPRGKSNMQALILDRMSTEEENKEERKNQVQEVAEGKDTKDTTTETIRDVATHSKSEPFCGIFV